MNGGKWRQKAAVLFNSLHPARGADEGLDVVGIVIERVTYSTLVLDEKDMLGLNRSCGSVGENVEW